MQQMNGGVVSNWKPHRTLHSGMRVRVPSPPLSLHTLSYSTLVNHTSDIMTDSTDNILMETHQLLLEKRAKADEEVRELGKQKTKIEDREIELESQIGVLDGLIAVIESKLDLIHRAGEIKSPISRTLLTSRLKKLSLGNALVYLARRGDGILNSYVARPLLTEAGLLKGSPGTASSRLYDALSDSEDFEPLGDKKGRWRLVTYDIDANQ